MRNLLVLSILAALAAVPALAKDDSDSCGLGWQVTSKKSLMATCTRGTTNAFVPPTFGMTTGTIGCAKHDIAKKDEAAMIYASANFDSLMMEMAQGQGEYLTGFARTMGCSDSAAVEFGRKTQQNYEAISNSKNSAELFQKVQTAAGNVCSA